MIESTEVDINDTLIGFVRKKRGKKNTKTVLKENAEKVRKKKVQEEAAAPEKSLPHSAADDQNVFDVSPGIIVSLFDYSIDNHFGAIDTICKVSGEPKSDEMEKSEVDRLSSSVTFLREWRHFNYPPRVLRFACQNEDGPQTSDVRGEINLPQFSAVTVPKNIDEDGSVIPPELRKDFLMYVGGLVWGLDWCPRVQHKYDSQIKCEFIAVAAHPPESSYHKIGTPLIGRGLIQIWCFINFNTKEEEDSQNKNPKKKASNKPATKANSSEPKKPRGRPRKDPVTITESSEPINPRGRPRKHPVDTLVENSNDSILCMEALAVEFPENSTNLLLMDTAPVDSDKHTKRVSARKSKGHYSRLLADDFELASPLKKRSLKDKAMVVNVSYNENLSLLTQNESIPGLPENPITCLNSEREPSEPSFSILKSCTPESTGSESVIPKSATLPRVVLCLAHNGKVAWDVKWRPYNVDDPAAKHRLGYLAVLLGNGALEVWEVPSPQTVKAIYSKRRKEGTDPRFLKLEPVFRCSKVKYGDRHSIPITLEWSTSAPHDLILAGCHDGVVALWKFSAFRTSEDSRPLLCFSADTVPIRALAWDPIESGSESANVVVTAGHKGLKFWDLRDPFRPLWELNPIQRNIFSLDWLPDPGCVIVSFDDGTLRILSLAKAANDVLVTGKPFVGTQQQGFHSYYCSSSAIWSVQVSRLTGMVAYCGAEGTVLQFQLTHKAVEKDPHRNRAPHFLCGSFSEEESALIVTSPLPNTPFPMKKSLNEWANAPRTIRGFLCVYNQAKRAKGKMEKGNTPKDQTLALCYGNDSGTGSESEDLMVPRKTKQRPKPKANNKEKGKSDLSLVCGEEVQLSREDCGSGENKNEIEKMPSKLVSMHRVRWNMNKGSERWLCSGGAAGLVRVQEIQRPFL